MNFEITAALSGLKSAIDFVKVAVDARDDAKMRQALADVVPKLLDANMSALQLSQDALALSSRVHQLEAQLRELEERQRERNRYILREMRPGAYCYTFNSVEGDPTPTHDVCQLCLDGEGIRSVLNSSAGGSSLHCLRNTAHDL